MIGRRGWLKTFSLGATAAALPAASGHAADATPKDKVCGVVFMVSDGMSPGVLTLAEAFSQLKFQRQTAWWRLLDNPDSSRGFMDTASANSLVTDSAAAASAWGGGQRVNNKSINVAPNGKSIEPIASVLKRKRKDKVNIGLVTTATTTHATPAGFAASVSNRGSEEEIAAQYFHRADVILGGGSGYYDAKSRADKRDLRGEFSAAGYAAPENRAQLAASRAEKLLGTFNSGHLPFAIDRKAHPNVAAAVPSLPEMATAALERFLANDKPFLLQIEGARIDHAAHLNDIAGLISDQLEFDDAIGTVLALTAKHPGVLVIVTSDHGNANPGLNGMGNGYMDSTSCFGSIARIRCSHERLFADWKFTREKSPENLKRLIAENLGFQLTAEETGGLMDILADKSIIEWNHQLGKPEGLLGQLAGNHTGIGWTGTCHTSDPTIISAFGPQSPRFAGMVRNSDVFGHLVEMLG